MNNAGKRYAYKKQQYIYNTFSTMSNLFKND